jgi:hypothetical protein
VDRKTIKNLRSVLAHLYPARDDALRITFDAGIDYSNIDTSGKVINIWHSILLEAEKNDQIFPILNIAYQEYKYNPELHRIYHDYISHRTLHEDPPKPHYNYSEQSSSRILNLDLRKEVTEIAICNSDPNVVYAVIDGTLFVSHDRARTWIYLPRNARRLAADPTDPSTIYTLLGNGLHASSDFGTNWRLVSTLLHYDPILSGQLVVHPLNNNYLLFSNNKGIFSSFNRGVTWQHSFRESTFSATYWFFALDNQDENKIVVTSYEKGIHITNDLGKRWQKLNAPPTGDELHPGLFQPLKFHPNDSSIWYADLGTHDTAHRDQFPKGLFVTSNLGRTWHCTSNEELHKHINYVDHIDFVRNGSQYMLFASSASGASYSVDHGQNWQAMRIQWKGLPDGVDNNSSMLDYGVIDAGTGDGLMYLKSRRGLLKSADNGHTWFY